MRNAKATTHDEYLEWVDEPQHTLLQKLRTAVKSMCPDAEEVINVGMPAFKYKGRPLVGYASAKQWCLLYTWSNSIAVRLEHELEKFTVSRGIIRFTPEEPLAAITIRKIVKIRMEETQKKNGMKKTRESKMLPHQYT